MTTVTISLPESLKEFIDHQLATKGYGNVSEYCRSLFRIVRVLHGKRDVERILKKESGDDDSWRRRRSADAGVLEGPQSRSARHRREAQGAEAAVKAVIRPRAQDDILRQFGWYLVELRMLFDWLVTGHVLDVKPVHAVRVPKYVVKKSRRRCSPPIKPASCSTASRS